MKPGQPVRFRKGNLAVVSLRDRPVQIMPDDLLAVWSEPPNVKSPRVIGHLNKNDVILITSVLNVDQHRQYSRIFSSLKGTIGWVNSKFLRKVQK